MSAPIALITGSSRGIGRGIAIEVARVGFSVAINFASREDSALECKRLCEAVAPKNAQSSFAVFQADISQSAGRTSLLESVLRHFGWIDLLVNNAGVAPTERKDLLETTEESFDRLMNINARSPFFLTQAAANVWVSHLKDRETSATKPKIVNITSVSAYTASVNRGEYCVSKAALSMMTQLFAVRLAEYGIGVFEIRPGVIETDMTGPVKEKYNKLIADGLTPIARWGTPEDVGRAVAALAMDQFPFSTGEVINVDGGFHIRRL